MVEVAIYARPTASVRLAFQMGGRVIRQWSGGNKEAVIVDLAGVYESTGVLPDMPYDWNKPPRKIDPPMMACLHCGREFEKRPNLIKTKKKWNVYRCPHCGEKNKERRLLRENEEEIKREYFKVETVEEVKKLSDIDLSNLERWSNAQYIDAIDELIKKNTFKYHYSGNRQWAVKIMSLCVRNDKDTFRKIVRGPFSIKRKWQMLMELKDYDITVK
jgi:superfamily II DNA or RNA helicase